jgi:hypothetical protein
VFPASKFDTSDGGVGQECATTGLSPVADLVVLSAGQAYGLVLAGALAPSSLCAPVDSSSVVQAGCPEPSDQLGPRLLQLAP